MLTVTPAARDYFSGLLQSQSEGMNLRLSTLHAGTPAAEVSLNYCPAGHEVDSDQVIDCQTFILFIEHDSMAALDGAMIDFESNATGGELSIRAPGLKGQAPADNAPLAERVQWVIDTRINPMIASHGGQVALVDITDRMEVVLQFGGGCHGCSMIDVTLKQGIETSLKEQIPEIQGVIDATDHSTGTNPYYQSAG
ncbi:MAG: NifU family protein [Pseudomonadota bacterium]